MPGESTGGFTNIGAVVVAALSLVALAASQQSELKGTRPKAETSLLHEPTPPQEIQARLWEDPFGSVLKAKTASEADKKVKCLFKGHLVREAYTGKAGPAGKSPTSQSRPEKSSPYIDSLSPDTITLAISVSGASYAADEEGRRRLRYATVSALGRHGFVPKDREHIGYFFLAKQESECKSPDSRAAIPFEVFDAKPDHKPTPQILVLWLDEANLVEQPLAYLANVVGRVTAHPNEHPVAIIAPSTSDGLLKLRQDIAKYEASENKEKKKISPFEGVRFYSATATADDMQLEELQDSNSGSAPRPSSKLSVLRTTPQDGRLAEVLAKELEHRGVNLTKDRIALVAEWDTLYGRLMLKTMRNKLNSDENAKNFVIKTYLRGVDGDVASSEKIVANDAQSMAKDATSVLERLAQAWRDPRSRESSVGVSQFDYIRRLAAELAKENDKTRPGGEAPIKAVGLLGNDVFDKLSLLQALKAALPGAIFFTTEYNAHLALPEHLRDSRNLLIASGYGDALEKELQGHIPQFRDSDQTSLFLTVQIALAQACTALWPENGARDCLAPELTPNSLDLLKNPELSQTPVRLFELSRRGEFVELRGLREEEKKPSVQPPLERSSADYGYGVLGGVLVFLGSVTPLLRRVAAPGPERTCKFLYFIYKYYWNILSIVCGLSILYMTVFFDHTRGFIEELRELTLIFSGVSLIGPLIFQIFIAALIFWFIISAFYQLDNNVVEISKTFKLDSPEKVMLGYGSRSCACRIMKQVLVISSWKSLKEVMYFTGTVMAQMVSGSTNQNLVYIVKNNWPVYVRHGEVIVRIFRVFVVFCIPTYIFIFIFMHYIANAANPGKSALSINKFNDICALNRVLSFLLLFIVVDTTFSCFIFVRRIGTVVTEWPENSRYIWKERFGSASVSQESMSDAENSLCGQYMDMLFIAKRTKCVNKLIWYPFIVFALLIIANSSYFANFPTSVPVLLLQMSGLAGAFGCAFALNGAAERLRAQTQEKLDRARGGGGIDKARWDEVRDWASKYDEGSFSSFLAQPAIAAVALPISSIGLPALVQWAGVFGQ